MLYLVIAAEILEYYVPFAQELFGVSVHIRGVPVSATSSMQLVKDLKKVSGESTGERYAKRTCSRPSSGWMLP